MNIKIEKAYDPLEIEQAQSRLAEIRFECLIKMFDFGVIEKERGLRLVEKKPMPPQWFKLQQKMSLEFIKFGDEYSIGRAIKEAFMKLEHTINEYENGNYNPTQLNEN